jgi:serine/threonine protein kinase
MIGTPIYTPAEILKGDKAIDPFLADLWALGITSYYVSYY